MEQMPRRMKVGRSEHYKRWTPGACLRVCFGHGLRLRWLAQAGRWTSSSESPLVQSVRSTARHLEAGHSYIQQIRNAVASRFLKMQNRAIIETCAESPPTYAIFCLSLDETEQDLRASQDKVKGRYNVMMVHGTLLLRFKSGVVAKEEVVMAPAAVGNTSGDTILAALHSSMPPAVAALTCPIVTMLNTDSAKSCKRVGRALAVSPSEPTSQNLMIHTFCMMHMLCVCMVLMVESCQGVSRFQGALHPSPRPEPPPPSPSEIPPLGQTRHNSDFARQLLRYREVIATRSGIAA